MRRVAAKADESHARLLERDSAAALWPRRRLAGAELSYDLRQGSASCRPQPAARNVRFEITWTPPGKQHLRQSSMPPLAIAYLAAYATFVSWSHVSDLRSEGGLLRVLGGVAGSACLLISALAFWVGASLDLSALVLVGLFTVGCTSLILEAILACQKLLADESLRVAGKWFVGTIWTALGLLLFSPLLYWGFSAAVLGRVIR